MKRVTDNEMVQALRKNFLEIWLPFPPTEQQVYQAMSGDVGFVLRVLSDLHLYCECIRLIVRYRGEKISLAANIDTRIWELYPEGPDTDDAFFQSVLLRIKNYDPTDLGEFALVADDKWCSCIEELILLWDLPSKILRKE